MAIEPEVAGKPEYTNTVYLYSILEKSFEKLCQGRVLARTWMVLTGQKTRRSGFQSQKDDLRRQSWDTSSAREPCLSHEPACPYTDPAAGSATD